MTTKHRAEQRVVKAAMVQFRMFLKRYGSVQAMLDATGTGDKLVRACAALAAQKVKKGGRK